MSTFTSGEGMEDTRGTDDEAAIRIAEEILAAIDAEARKYEDITQRGGNPYEYGMLTRAEVVANELIRRGFIPGQVTK